MTICCPCPSIGFLVCGSITITFNRWESVREGCTFGERVFDGMSPDYVPMVGLETFAPSLFFMFRRSADAGVHGCGDDPQIEAQVSSYQSRAKRNVLVTCLFLVRTFAVSHFGCSICLLAFISNSFVSVETHRVL